MPSPGRRHRPRRRRRRCRRAATGRRGSLASEIWSAVVQLGAGNRARSTGYARNIMETLNYLNNGHGAASWLLTKDHKRIALLYLASITAFFFLGGMFAFVIRLELLT